MPHEWFNPRNKNAVQNTSISDDSFTGVDSLEMNYRSNEMLFTRSESFTDVINQHISSNVAGELGLLETNESDQPLKQHTTQTTPAGSGFWARLIFRMNRYDLATKYYILMELFEDWGLNTSSHGISNILRLESKPLKLIWLISFLACSGYCIYTVISILLSFLQYGVLTNQQVINASPIDFPAVTFCNVNPFNRIYADPYINKTLERNNLTYVFDPSQIGMDPSQVMMLIKSTVKSDQNLSAADVQKMGFDLNYLWLTCYYNSIPCNKSDFTYRYDFEYTNCYTFNSGFDENGNKVPIKQANEAGSNKGLSLEVFLGDDATQSRFMANGGARIVVHNQTQVPIIISEGVDIAAGFQTNIGVRRSFLNKLSSPYSDCIDSIDSPDGFDSSYFKAIFNVLNMTKYSQKWCLRICLQAYVLASCSCLDGSLPNIYGHGVPVCNNISTIDCVSDSRNNYYKNGVSCDQCPLECDSQDFQLSLSNSRYPTRYYQSYLTVKTPVYERLPAGYKSEITKTTVLFSVFYEDLATTYTTEIPEITPEGLLGNIGGNMGLFIGISLLTVVEILEVSLNSLFIFISHFRQKKKKTDKIKEEQEEKVVRF